MDDKTFALISQLETSLLSVWPSVDQHIVNGWAVRSAHGYSGRANSASAISPGCKISESFLSFVENYFHSKTLPPTFRLSPLCTYDAKQKLLAHGYTSRGLAHTMTARLVPSKHLVEHRLLLEAKATDAWLTGTTARQDDPSKRLPQALQSIVSCITLPVRFATLASQDEDIGFGVVAIDKSWAEIGSIVIDEKHRGRGLGRVLVSSLMTWAKENGADHAYLQVDVNNAAAIALYRSLGFSVLYDYDTLRRKAET